MKTCKMKLAYIAVPSDWSYYTAIKTTAVRDMDLRDPATMADRFGNGHMLVKGIGPFATATEADAAAAAAYLGNDEDGTAHTATVWAYDAEEYE